MKIISCLACFAADKNKVRFRHFVRVGEIPSRNELFVVCFGPAQRIASFLSHLFFAPFQIAIARDALRGILTVLEQGRELQPFFVTIDLAPNVSI